MGVLLRLVFLIPAVNETALGAVMGGGWAVWHVVLAVCLVLIMLTARRDEVDKLVGLAVGADDYLTKPFSQRELVARVKAMLRRPRADERPPGSIAVGPLTIDVDGREVVLDGKTVGLTPTEFELLATLATRPRLVLSRRKLIEAVWGEPWVGDERMVDVHIRNLRRKLGDDAEAPRFVRTVRGAGYRIGSGA